ncbi:hypothetical protein ACMX9J_14315 [Priestia sp. RMT2NF4]|uniref:hypothetical protein n=1 Tax=Priestia sp. RMT2NF4 TaxID=3398394 RepID=UPI003A4C7809
MGEKHKFEMNVNGETIKWEEKSYAQIFRNFWAYFMEKDLQKTIHIIELAGVRTSESEYFIAKNGGKKKNIFVKDNLWVYTHLNPQAMDKVYAKFIKSWEEHYETPQPETFGDGVQLTEKNKAEETPKLKNIYKKTLAMDLIRMGHDLNHTMRNRNNPKYQVYVMVETPEMIRDMLYISERDRVNKRYNNVNK